MQLTTAQILKVHNTQDTRPLRDWRKSKSALAARVAAKGGVCRTVARLLVDTDLPYAAIVEQVKSLHPAASTRSQIGRRMARHFVKVRCEDMLHCATIHKEKPVLPK